MASEPSAPRAIAGATARWSGEEDTSRGSLKLAPPLSEKDSRIGLGGGGSPPKGDPLASSQTMYRRGVGRPLSTTILAW